MMSKQQKTAGESTDYADLTDFNSIRCSGCGARLMDTDGKKIEYGGITIRIKCWRCRAIKLVVLSYNQRQQDQQEAA